MRTSESVVRTRYCPGFPADDPDHHRLQPLDCAAESSAALIVIQYDRNDLAASRIEGKYAEKGCKPAKGSVV